jgi:prolyl 4-hydroxylase
MYVERICADPEVLFVTGFVSEAEADDLMWAANGRFDRSTTVCDKPDGRCTVADRSSSSAVLPATSITEAVRGRGRTFAATTSKAACGPQRHDSGAPMAEELQIVRYHPGQEYRPHHDAFDDSEGGRQAKAMYGGRQREATILIYLNCPEEGGETVFPTLGLSVAPVPRAAVFWRNLYPDGSIDHRLLHGGAPVRRGVKYAANLWLRGLPGSVRWP